MFLAQGFYILLAILGIGILFLVHELGHYWMARKMGMKIEVFSIGFGKALYFWERKGVRFQIGILPFGGYVRIAGMQTEGNKDPYSDPEGFFGKKPWRRILVASAGPLSNFIFAFIVFFAIWFLGGRESFFSEHTSRIGWVDPSSELFQKGVRPGDEIVEYGNRPFGGIQDLLYTSLKKEKSVQIKGFNVDYYQGKKTPFEYSLAPYKSALIHPYFSTIGILAPAQCLIYTKQGNQENPSLLASGIQEGDKVIWADGEFVFSPMQLSSIVNRPLAFLTVERKNEILHLQVPRVELQELKLESFEKAEFDDWRHEKQVKRKLSFLFVLPYHLSEDGVVEKPFEFVDPEKGKILFKEFQALQEGDRILAVGKTPVATSQDLFSHLQQREVLLIVERALLNKKVLPWKTADLELESFLLEKNAHLKKMIDQIGQPNVVSEANGFYLLKPIQPQKILESFPGTVQHKESLEKELSDYQKHVEEIPSDQKREEAKSRYIKSQNKLVLGMGLLDQRVSYNPSPWRLFVDVLSQTGSTLGSLVTGTLPPKFLSGPVGVVQVMYYHWSVGIKEALFWLALISVNLGILNLLPIPVLDGGHILFSCIEGITKKPIPLKVMERWMVPFFFFLILVFIFVTYHDLSRLLGKFFH